MGCWMFPERPPVFIVLGRYGDIIQMLPCFKAVHDRIKMKPVVIVSHEYATVLEGVSYCTPHVIRGHWYMGIPNARRIAEMQYGGGIVAQWWHDTEHAEMLPEANRGGLVLQCHGHEWGVDMHKWPNYGASMADRCGFKLEEWKRLPLVFDQRSKEREAALCRKVIGGDRRPLLLYNFSGISSRFAYAPEVMNPLLKEFGKSLHMVDIGKVYAHRIYDLLGLYERAIGLVTIDTSTLHLAQASPIHYMAYTVGGWTQSVPKGKCDLQITYDESPGRIGEVIALINRWKARHVDVPSMVPLQRV